MVGLDLFETPMGIDVKEAFKNADFDDDDEFTAPIDYEGIFAYTPIYLKFDIVYQRPYDYEPPEYFDEGTITCWPQ